jgi:hypothetical protein
MQGGMMAWYWEVIMAVIIFDIAFVSAALVRSMIFERKATSLSEERQESLLPQESILHFLASLSLAEREKNTYLTASPKG